MSGAFFPSTFCALLFSSSAVSLPAQFLSEKESFLDLTLEGLKESRKRREKGLMLGIALQKENANLEKKVLLWAWVDSWEAKHFHYLALQVAYISGCKVLLFQIGYHFLCNLRTQTAYTRLIPHDRTSEGTFLCRVPLSWAGCRHLYQ